MSLADDRHVLLLTGLSTRRLGSAAAAWRLQTRLALQAQIVWGLRSSAARSPSSRWQLVLSAECYNTGRARLRKRATGVPRLGSVLTQSYFPKRLSLHDLSLLRRAESKCSGHCSVITVPLPPPQRALGKFCTCGKITSHPETSCNPEAFHCNSQDPRKRVLEG